MKNIYCLFLSVIFLFGCSDRDSNIISATGTIEATDVIISAQVSGVIKRIIVEEGNKVKAGDTLVIIDNTELKLQYEQAKAAYEITVAQYQLAVKGAREEDILQAEANYKNAESDLKRIEELYREKVATPKQLDDARTRFTINKQLYEKMLKGTRKEELDAALAKLNQAKAQMMLLQKKLNDCNVIAPTNGIVTKRFAGVGELAAMGMALYKISDLTMMDITIYVSEVDLPRIKLNQNAIVNIDAYRDKNFEGKVVFISPVAEFTPKNIQTKEERTKLVFAVKVKVSNPHDILKAGIPADVNLLVNE